MSAKQESKTSTGKSFVSKQFEQRFTLPPGVQAEKITSKLGVDGVLRISAPKESSSLRRQDALEDRSLRRQDVVEERGGSRAVTKSSDGLPEPKIKYEKDKLEIRVDASEYR